jgi:hypothetical protein
VYVAVFINHSSSARAAPSFFPFYFVSLTVMAQYGNGGYNQVGYGSNPYDQREDAMGDGRYNNYSQGRYDDGTRSPQVPSGAEI